MLVEFAKRKSALWVKAGSPALSYWVKFEHRLFGYRG
jgi:hypothetical protein